MVSGLPVAVYCGASPTLCRGKTVMDMQTLLVCFRGENPLLGIHNMCCHQLGVSSVHRSRFRFITTLTRQLEQYPPSALQQ